MRGHSIREGRKGVGSRLLTAGGGFVVFARAVYQPGRGRTGEDRALPRRELIDDCRSAEGLD